MMARLDIELAGAGAVNVPRPRRRHKAELAAMLANLLEAHRKAAHLSKSQALIRFRNVAERVTREAAQKQFPEAVKP